MAQHAGRMADQCNGFARSERRLDQADRDRVFGEVPERPMSAGIEDGVVISGIDGIEPGRVRQQGGRLTIGFEAPGLLQEP